MKKLLVAGITADMPAKGPVYKAAPAPMFNWTGFYVGGHVGYAWSDPHWLTNHVSGIAGPCLTSLFVTPCDPVNQKSNGFVGGGQVGARWQTGSWVFGVEGTLAGSHLSSSTTSTLLPTIIYDTKVREIYTGTAQVGYAWDRSLWYVKGGYAGSRLFLNSTDSGVVFGPVNVNANGWTIGTGLEYSFLPNWSLGVEYDYIHLRAGDVSTCTTGVASVFSCPTATPLRYTNIRDNISEVLVRLNYRFAWGAR
jgi:outer membrane immunogenic protein